MRKVNEMEGQEEIMKKIKAMEKWIEEQKDSFPIISSDRMRVVNAIRIVGKRIDEANAVLQFLQRGQVFDLPEEVVE